jgi:hypothetical protein
LLYLKTSESLSTLRYPSLASRSRRKNLL